MIKAPYNFVPLSEKVFFPPWAEQVSHDIPFSDGESGEIEIKITAKSPIFIRDHEEKEEFCHYINKDNEKEYYIPGSSVKGMIRNVLEIMSFSKMKFVDDDTYAVRDLRNSNLYTRHFNINNVFCGWLRKVDSHYVVEDCGTPGWIKHSDIDEFFSGFSTRFTSSLDDKSAKYKYDNYTQGKLFSSSFGYEEQDEYGKQLYNKGTKKEGTIVFTGQASPRVFNNRQQKMTGKGHEFVFFDVKNTYILDKHVFENFKFAYFDGRKTQPEESDDWKYWKKRLYRGEKIPIFFQKNEDNKILHMGLSYLYKLPYTKSIKDGIYLSHHDISHHADLSEIIFGYTDKNTKKSLKGRVQFSHIKHKNGEACTDKKTVLLGTPRASYYPIYIKQKNGLAYATLMDNNSIIAGWKRYPIHKNQPNHRNEEEGVMTTSFYPLEKDSTFEGKIRFHNLRKSELGALLSALTFHNNELCFHSIGLAKSLGYGKNKLEIKKVTIQDSKNEAINDLNIEEFINDHIKYFENEISTQIHKWSGTEELKELFTMSREQDNTGNSKLEYIGDHQAYSNSKTTATAITSDDYLQSYSVLENIVINKPKRLSIIGLYNQELVNSIATKHKLQDLQYLENNNNLELIRLFMEKYPHTPEAKKVAIILNGFTPTQNNQITNEIHKKIEILKQTEVENRTKEYVQELKNFSEQVQNIRIRKVYTFANLSKKLNIDTPVLEDIFTKLNIDVSQQNPIPQEHVLQVINVRLEENGSVCVANLLSELNISIEELEQFADDEYIDLAIENGYMPAKVANLVRENMQCLKQSYQS